MSMKLTPSSTARRRTCFAVCRIFGLTPDAFAGDAHGTVAEAVDCEIAAE